MKAAKSLAVLGPITLCALLGLALALAPGSAFAQAPTCTKSDTPDPVAPGGAITYTITFSSDEAVNNVVLTDPVPAQTTFRSFTAPSGWTNVTPFVGGTGAVTSTRAGSFVGTATFTLVVDASPLAVGTIDNTATFAEFGGPTLCTAMATTAVETPPPPCEKFKEHKNDPDKSKCKDK
jgi:uncharacterized repeat protein (TIGR01451 family)